MLCTVFFHKLIDFQISNLSKSTSLFVEVYPRHVSRFHKGCCTFLSGILSPHSIATSGKSGIKRLMVVASKRSNKPEEKLLAKLVHELSSAPRTTSPTVVVMPSRTKLI